MPAPRKRRIGSKSVRESTLKQPTLTGKPARFDLGSGEALLRIRTPFEPLRETMDKAIDQRLTRLDGDRSARDMAVVKRQRDDIDRALEAVRGIEELTREVILDGFGGLLGLSLFHPGGPDVKGDVMAEQRKASTEGARKARDAKAERQLAASVNGIVQDLAVRLWDADRKINGRYKFRKRHTATADAIFLKLSTTLRKVVPVTSIYYPPSSDDGRLYADYRLKLINSIRKASRYFEDTNPA